MPIQTNYPPSSPDICTLGLKPLHIEQINANVAQGLLRPDLIYAHLGLIYPHPALTYAHLGLKAFHLALINANLGLIPLH